MLDRLNKIIEWIDNFNLCFTDKLSNFEWVNHDTSLMQLIKINSEWKKVLNENNNKYFSNELILQFKKLAGTRNYGVHDYMNVDFGIIYEINKIEMPKLKNNLLISIQKIKMSNKDLTKRK